MDSARSSFILLHLASGSLSSQKILFRYPICDWRGHLLPPIRKSRSAKSTQRSCCPSRKKMSDYYYVQGFKASFSRPTIVSLVLIVAKSCLERYSCSMINHENATLKHFRFDTLWVHFHPIWKQINSMQSCDVSGAGWNVKINAFLWGDIGIANVLWLFK